MTLQTGSRAAVLRRSERTRFSVGERRRRRRLPARSARSERERVEQSNTGSRAAVLRRSERHAFRPRATTKEAGSRARSARSERSEWSNRTPDRALPC